MFLFRKPSCTIDDKHQDRIIAELEKILPDAIEAARRQQELNQVRVRREIVHGYECTIGF